MKNLTTDRLQTFFDGNLWIITRRKKTNTESNIRLLDVPKRIIEKYKGLARDGHVFPVPSNGSCNKILKGIGRQCGFKVRLTYHVARHTNATTVLLSHGVPIETVSRLFGAHEHKNHPDLRQNHCPEDKPRHGNLVAQVGGHGKEYLPSHLKP